MTVLKIVIFTLVVYSFAYYLGGKLIYAIDRIFKAPIPKNATLRIFTGGATIIFVGSLVCFLAGILKAPAQTSFAIALVLLVVAYAGLYLAERKEKQKGFVDCEIDKFTVDNKALIYILLLAAVICLQIVIVINCSFREIEPIRHIDVATKVYDSGYLVATSPIMNLWGCVSCVMGIHPLILIYTYLPAVTIILYYLGYFEVMRVLLDKNENATIVSLLFVAMLNIWGYQSQLLAPFNLLISWYTGDCYITGFLLPLIACIWIRVARYKASIRAIDRQEIKALAKEDIYEEDYLEEWDMKKHKIINARNLAIAMVVMVIALVAVVFVLNNKINSLHDSTANLQRDLDSRCAMYEFSPTNGQVEGYLIKGSDGSLTVIGGGSAENADALMKLIDANVTNPEIDNWYLYSNEESDMGAYLMCAYQKGLNVKNVYVLEATSLTE